jgi:hypothetical protein
VSIKLVRSCRLFQSDPAGDNFGACVTLGTDKDTRCPAEHRKLTDMRQRVA